MDLDKKYEFKQKLHAKIVEQFLGNPKHFSDVLWYNHETFALHSLMQGNLAEAKQHFYTCGKLDEYRIRSFNDRIFDYGINHVCYALLSDAHNFLKQYALLRYEKGKNAEAGMNEMITQGFSTIICNTIQLFILNDIKGIERNLNIIEEFTVKRDPFLALDLRFFQALHESNSQKMSETIEELVSPSVHKKRNTDSVLSNCISIPAIGYLKLAWLKGSEIIPQSSLLPKELLPVDPLPVYKDIYPFL
ncbi:Imm49 family immunity protein [Flavisolibacter tropicus]|uniref:Uncharacterized protein n=1 Tax=Flavisolibacter tropicus TaxID=1492898 RepID=A0A172TZS6_9BACT|nr:Imm49 family immunity protein [Flavisolibacter tropicus]ANE52609.1 hypothetical protein SY85_21120 [Flavisolibacter tropicus]